MAQEKGTFTFVVKAESAGNAGSAATALIDTLLGVDGVVSADRGKADSITMDIGSIVSVVATSGATIALAHGVAAWLKARRGVTITIEKSGASGKLKAAVSGIDPASAERIFETARLF